MNRTIGHLGIRYATAARFEPPVPVAFAGIGSEAGTAGPIAPQVPGLLENLLGMDVGSMSEDCLHLNVFRPADAVPGSDLPVLVWVHGGAFQNGSGSIPWYDGSSLASRGTVVVTINYRLGALGFLGRRNSGTLDQICALGWVRDNISAFGGDAGNVTIFGESAGGSGVLALLAAPGAKGLFHRVWSMSPSIRQLRDVAAAEKWEAAFLSELGVGTIDEARDAGLDRILGAQARVAAMPNDGYDMFAPTAGGDGLDADFDAAFGSSELPVVIGTNRDENSLFLAFDPEVAGCSHDKWVAHARAHFGGAADHAIARYEEHRPSATPAQLIAAVQTDHVFRRPAQRVAESRVAAGNQTWMYWFTWATPVFDGALGSCHALDIPFAFDNIHAQGSEMLLGTGPERAGIAARFADEICRFAREGSAGWPAFDLRDRTTLRIDEECEVLNDPEPALRLLHE